MSSDQDSLTQPEEQPETRSFREVTTLGRMAESIAKELNESLSGVVINASTCLRMLAADPRMSREHARLHIGRFATATVQRKQFHG
jgi:hypothetical protein